MYALLFASRSIITGHLKLDAYVFSLKMVWRVQYYEFFYMLFLLFANSHQHTTFGICNYAISYHFLLCLQFLVSYCIWGGQRMDDVSV